MEPGLYRVIAGEFVGAIVRMHLINVAGNADCRFAEDFRPYAKGQPIVFDPDDIKRIGE